MDEQRADVAALRARIAVLEAALERLAIGDGRALGVTVFLSSSDLAQVYIQRIERMKQVAAQALAADAGAQEAG